MVTECSASVRAAGQVSADSGFSLCTTSNHGERGIDAMCRQQLACVLHMVEF